MYEMNQSQGYGIKDVHKHKVVTTIDLVKSKIINAREGI